MTTEQLAQFFREVDDLAAEARRALHLDGDTGRARGCLLEIQLMAQTALRESQGNAQTEAMDYACGFLTRRAKGLHASKTGEMT